MTEGGVGAVARRLGVLLPTAFTLATLGLTRTVAHLRSLDDLTDSLHVHGSEVVPLGVAVGVALVVVVAALRHGAPAWLPLAAAALPWLVALGAAWLRTDAALPFLTEHDWVEPDPWLRWEREILDLVALGIRYTAALLASVSIVLTVTARSDADRRDELRAIAAIAGVGAASATYFAVRGDAVANATTYSDDFADAAQRFATLARQIRLLDASGLLLVVLAVGVAAWLARPVLSSGARDARVRVGLAALAVLVLPTLDRVGMFACSALVLGATQRPWAELEDFTPLSISEGWPPQGGTDVGTDRDGPIDQTGRHVPIDEIESRWADLYRDVPELVRGESSWRFYEEPGCEPPHRLDGVSVFADARTSGATIRALAAAAYGAGAPTLRWLGRAPVDVDPSLRVGLASRYEHVAWPLVDEGFATTPPDCAPTDDELLVVGVEIGRDTTRTSVWTTGAELTSEALAAFRAETPDVRTLALVAIAEDATAEDLIDAVEMLEGWELDDDGERRLLSGPMPAPPPRRWSVLGARSTFDDATTALVTQALAPHAAAFGACVEPSALWLRRGELTLLLGVEDGRLRSVLPGDCIAAALDHVAVPAELTAWTGFVTLVYAPEP